jgi:DNA repair protein RecO (recombination protein O)
MSRTQSHSALILRSRSSGEANRDVWLLSAEAGLLRATVFGGPKSRLRAHASPFNSGQVWIYHEPVKDTRKMSDFDVRSWRPGLRELYERAMAADAIAETILASHGGGGNWATALSLAEGFLDAMEHADEETCGRLLVCFFWRWAGFLGLQPELENCASCGTAAAGVLWYSPHEGGLLCADCAGAEGGTAGLVSVNAGCRRWLETVRALSPAHIGRYTMDAQSSREAKALCAAILAGALGRRLASWEW